MTPERWEKLNREGKGLTLEEYKQGWHYCVEWDLMLVGPGMCELEACHCSDPPTCPTCED